jgi:hypothetical protein
VPRCPSGYPRRREPRSPLGGLVGFGPGFVEGHELLQRIDGVGVFGAELGLAAVEGIEEQPLGVLVAGLPVVQDAQFVHGLEAGGMVRARLYGCTFENPGCTLFVSPSRLQLLGDQLYPIP